MCTEIFPDNTGSLADVQEWLMDWCDLSPADAKQVLDEFLDAKFHDRPTWLSSAYSNELEDFAYEWKKKELSEQA